MQPIIKAYYDWLISEPEIIYYNQNNRGKNYWEISDKTFAGSHRVEVWDTKKEEIKEKFSQFLDSLDINCSLENWSNNGFYLNSSTMSKYHKPLFHYLYNTLEDKDPLLAMGARLLDHKYWINIISDNKEILKRYLLVKPKSFAKLLTHEDFIKVFNLINKNFSGQEYEDILFSFIESRPKQISRIEAQLFLEKSLKNVIKPERFNKFLNKVSDKSSYLVSKGCVISFNVDKKLFYIAMCKIGNPLPKYEITVFLENFIHYLSEYEKERLHIVKAHLLNKDQGLPYYTLVFDCTQDNPTLNYQDIVISSLDNCPINNHKETFRAVVNKYFLDKVLEGQEIKGKIEKVKKI